MLDSPTKPNRESEEKLNSQPITEDQFNTAIEAWWAKEASGDGFKSTADVADFIMEQFRDNNLPKELAEHMKGKLIDAVGAEDVFQLDYEKKPGETMPEIPSEIKAMWAEVWEEIKAMQN